MKNPLRWLMPDAAGRRLSSEPDGPQEEKTAAYGSLFALAAPGQPRWGAKDYASMARAGFMANPIVHRCVRLIAESAAQIPLLAYSGSVEVEDHSLLDLVNRPNGRQTGSDLLEEAFGHLLIGGNAYLEAVGVDDAPTELYALRPDRVKVCTDTRGWVTGYEYGTGKNKVRHRLDDEGRSPVLHLTLFHPLDDHYGFAPLCAALMALDMHASANGWNKALLDNSARPSGALVYSGATLDAAQFERLKRELEEGYAGARSAGRPLLLEGGLDWKTMGYSPRDMDFVEARNGAARDIALAFGVPPMLLGIPGDNTYSNYQEANRAFVRQTVLPLARRTVRSLGNWLAPRFGDDLRLTIDDDRVEGLGDDRQALWKRINEATFLDDDEKRDAVGYSPRDKSGVSS